MVYFYSLSSRVRGLFGYRSYSTKESHIEKFLIHFSSKLLDDQNHHSISSNSNVSQYQDVVLNMLHQKKKEKFTDDELVELQISIESLTTQFDDVKSIYQIAPDLIKKFLSKEKPTAKDFLKSCSLSSDYLDSINLISILWRHL